MDKIQILTGHNDDLTSLTFQISDEDHTLGNALRHIIMSNPKVEFCAYSIPHPSEPKMNLRIQTKDGDYSAIQALMSGLDQLEGQCDTIAEKFQSELQENDIDLPNQ